MHDLTADHEKIREVMVRFGEILETQGYPKVLEDIEGHGTIGKAVREPRTIAALKIIDRFLKDIGIELQKEPPSQEKANAIAALKQAFQAIKNSIRVEA